jgi:hypothetical protein
LAVYIEFNLAPIYVLLNLSRLFRECFDYSALAVWAAAWAESKAKLLEVEAIVSLFQRWTSFLQDY